MSFQQIKSASVQIIGTLKISLFEYIVLIVVVPFLANFLVDRMIVKGMFTKVAAERRALGLTMLGTFIIALAISANSAIRFGSLPSTVSLFNPLIGFLPIYIAYLLQRAIYDGRIK